MKLTKIKIIELIPSAPFNFDATFHKPDHFTSDDNLWESGTRWQTWIWEKKCLGIRFKNIESTESPKIEISIYSVEKLDKEFINRLIDEIKYRYNLELDLALFYKKFENDKILRPIIKKWQGMKPGHPSSLYEYLLIGIVLQNATVRRSVQMFKALFKNYGTELEFDGKKLWCFFKPGRLQKISEDGVVLNNLRL